MQVVLLVIVHTAWTKAPIHCVDKGTDTHCVDKGTDTHCVDKGTDTHCVDKGANTHCVDKGTDTHCVDKGANTHCVDKGTDTHCVDKGADTHCVDKGTDTHCVDKGADTHCVDKGTDTHCVEKGADTLRGQGHRYTLRGQGRRYTQRGQGRRYTLRGQGHRYTLRGQRHRYTLRGQRHRYTLRGQRHRYTLRGQRHRYTANVYMRRQGWGCGLIVNTGNEVINLIFDTNHVQSPLLYCPVSYLEFKYVDVTVRRRGCSQTGGCEIISSVDVTVRRRGCSQTGGCEIISSVDVTVRRRGCSQTDGCEIISSVGVTVRRRGCSQTGWFRLAERVSSSQLDTYKENRQGETITEEEKKVQAVCRYCGWTMKFLLLAVTVMVYDQLTAGHVLTSNDVLARPEVLKLFVELTQPFDRTKDALNTIADSRVDGIITKLRDISPALQNFLQIIQAIKENMPVHQNQSMASLSELTSHLLTASSSLNQVLRDCSNKKTVSSAGSDMKEPQKVVDSQEFASRLTQLLNQRPAAAARPLAGADTVVSAQDLDQLVAQLVRPVEVNTNEASALIARYGKDKYVSVEDASDAVLQLATIIAEKHRTRFLRLLPKMKLTDNNIDEILSSLETLQVEVLRLLQISEGLKNQMHENLAVIHGLAQSISSTVQGISCTA
ncbi:hypothetical protein Btru_072008 [Bulinus truncatus]|nr:hypothetical protein Btru_072008 [Bulinus truncatus]